MDFEWDSAKNERNIHRHGIDFEFAKLIFAEATLERIDDRRDYGEVRWIAIGAVGGLEVTVVYTWRGQTRRLISARRSHSSERRAYRQAFPDVGGSRPNRS